MADERALLQAQKFSDQSAHDAIADESSPVEAARLGRSSQWQLRTDWERAKDDVMRVAVRSKVAQHQDVYETLLATGAAMLVEHTTNDRYWGDGGDGSGRNMLNQAVMARFRASEEWAKSCSLGGK